MKKLLLFGIPTVLLLLVMLYIFVFLININKVKVLPKDLQTNNQEKNQIKPTPKDWRLGLDKKGSEDSFYYPVTEITIDLNLFQDVDDKYRHRVRQFKLVTQKLNSYHYFCLKQVLDQLHTHHKLEAYQNEIGVILYSNNSKNLQEVVDNLSTYQIKSSIHEIFKEDK